MNISYNWLKEYVNFDLTPDEVAEALTSIGLETGGVEEVQTIKGGLEGIVIGEVLTCEPHPNSDHMHVTTVNLGQGEPVQIVCGAANVAAGQKVVVATLGTKLYDGEECFTIKKSKLRGVESMGMICAEDEIGIGNSHEGIIVLPADAVPGTPAKDYFNIKSEYVLEVDITPNRADACSHYGVARDLYAYLIQNGKQATLKRPSVEAFKVDNHDMDIAIEVENTEACPRYAGVSIKGVTVKESPEWLQNKLRLIGVRPINNIVDITNYVMLEYGQPMHAFDYRYVKGGRIIVRRAEEGEELTTLDGQVRKLNANHLVIADETRAVVEREEMLRELLAAEGLLLKNHADCGCLLYDAGEQRVKSGGSGAGCCAAVLCGHILPKLLRRGSRRVLFIATGALMSQTTFLQKESIPAVAHLVELTAPEKES